MGLVVVCGAALAPAAPASAQTLEADYQLVGTLADWTGTYGSVQLLGNPEPPDFPTNGACQNGIHYNDPDGQDIATPHITGLDSTDFQITLEFNLTSLPDTSAPVIIGSQLYRWFGLRVDSSGRLGVTYNNGLVVWSETSVNTGTWYSAQLRFENGRTQLFLDGTVRMDATIGSLSTGGEYDFRTNNYGEGTALHGCIRYLQFYNDTTLVPAADLVLTKTGDNSGAVHVGQTLTYTIEVTNTGPDNATGVSVVDSLPPQVAYDSDTCGGVYDGGTHMWSWDAGDLTLGASTSCDVAVTVEPGATGSVNNIASATLNESDPNFLDNGDTHSATIEPTADLAVTKTADVSGTLYAGYVVTYTVGVTNNGPDDAPGVTVSDSLPAEMAYTSDTCGGSYDGGSHTWTWSVGTLANGASATCDVVTEVVPGSEGPAVNTATVSGAAYDPTAGNDSASVESTTALSADLAVDKTTSASGTVYGGEELVYTVHATNGGPDEATGVTVGDDLPAGTTYVSDTCGGTYSGGAHSWTWAVGTLAAGTTVPCTLVVELPLDSSGPVLNTATLSGDQDDLEPGNNSDTLGVDTAPAVDVAVTKTTGATGPQNPGDQVTYTIGVTNNGPGDALGVEVSDTLPAEMAYVSDTCGGSHSAGTWTWTVGALANGASGSCDLVAEVLPGATGTVTNTATASAAQFDHDASNDSGSAAVDTVSSADLAITKTSDAAGTVYAGDQLTYTIGVTNNGPLDATGVEVSDTLPAEMAYVSDTCGGSHSAGTWTWSIGSLADAASQSCDVVVEVQPGSDGDVVNTATVSGTEDDPTPGNDSSSATVTAALSADLAITKGSDAAGTVYAGDQLTYTIDVTNTGPDDATGVEVSDTLPSEVAYVSDTCGGSDSAGTWTWSVGALADGGSTACDVVVEVQPGSDGDVVNTAGVSGTEYDPTADNDSGSTAVTTALSADLEVAKTSDADGTLYPGDQLTYTIDVTNTGPDDATGIEVTDALPALVSYVSDTCSGSYDGGTQTWTWTVGALADGASTTCDVVVEVVPGANGPIENTAAVAGTEFDPTAGNDTATASAAVSAAEPGIPALGGTGAGLLIVLLAAGGLLVLRRRVV